MEKLTEEEQRANAEQRLMWSPGQLQMVDPVTGELKPIPGDPYGFLFGGEDSDDNDASIEPANDLEQKSSTPRKAQVHFHVHKK